MSPTIYIVLMTSYHNFFHDAAIDAQRPDGMIAMFLGILDEVQLFIEPDLDFDKLQKEIDSKI